MLIDVLYIIFTEYGGEPWTTTLLAEMVNFNPKERPSFSKIVEGFAKHVNTTLMSWSPFSSVSGKAFLNYMVYYAVNRKIKNKFSYNAK